MVLGILLIVLGLSVVAMAAAWRSGLVLGSAQWLMRWVSPPMVVATPAAGLMVASVGLMLIWPPGVIFAFGCAIGWVAVLILAARNGTANRLPHGLRAPERTDDGAGRARAAATPPDPKPPAWVSGSPGTRTGSGTPRASSTPRRQAR
jgi:hypothetical protein